MGMYNMIFGVNPAADFLLALCDLTKNEVGRFRDAFVTEDGKELAVYTRNGGGNREHWREKEPEGLDCDCPGCIITYRLPVHPLYLRDKDDEFDCTYATVFFRFPEVALSLVKDLAEKRDPNQLWFDTLAQLQEGKRPDIVEKFRPLMESITKVLSK